MAGVGIDNFDDLANFIVDSDPKLQVDAKKIANLRTMHTLMPMVYDAVSGYKADTKNYPDATALSQAIGALIVAFS